MKYFHLCYLMLISIFCTAQTDCCTASDRQEPGELFNEALSLCFLNNEDECFLMRAESVSGAFPYCPINTLENPHWYVLFPSSDEFELEISWTNGPKNLGIQVGLYQLKASQKYQACQTLDYNSLVPSQMFCEDAISPVTLTQENAADQVYYLLIDGTRGDECQYTIHSNSGIYRGGLADSLSLTGPQGIPEGYTATFNAQRFVHECFEQYGCHCGICNLDTFVVEWTAPPGAIVETVEGSLQADITMASTGGQVCIKIQDDCDNLLRCVQVELTDIEFYQKCPTADLDIRGQNFIDPGVYFVEESGFVYQINVENYVEVRVEENWEGCIDEEFQDCFFNVIAYPTKDEMCSRIMNDTCFTFEYHINWIVPDTITVFDTICEGNYLVFCGDTLRDQGTSECTFMSSSACDSIVQLVLTVTASDTTFVTPIICYPEVYVLQGDTFGSSGNYIIENKNATDCQEYISIDLVVQEIDTTHVIDTICNLEFIDFCGVDINSEGVYYCRFQTDEACDSVVKLSLIQPCRPITTIKDLCSNEAVTINDSLLNSEGIYYIPRAISSSCYCIDTVVLTMATLGSTSIVSSGELNCSNSVARLKIQWDPLQLPNVVSQTWYDMFGTEMGTRDEIEVTKPGLYSTVVRYETLSSGLCTDTLSYSLEGDQAFAPTLTWLTRELFICDTADQEYFIEFNTDAPHSLLTLNGTDKEWIDLNKIEIPLDKNEQSYSFTLKLFDQTKSCSEVFDFVVQRQELLTTWPDTVYTQSITSLPNPLVELAIEATNISFSPSNFIEGQTGSVLLFNQNARGEFALSFDIGSCHYDYRTFIQRDNIFIPTAFSPNGDGVNDRLRSFNTPGFELIEIQIYNRWGGQVFSSNVTPIEWDGNSDGKPMAAGIYLVRYSYVDRMGEKITKTSELMLLR